MKNKIKEYRNSTEFALAIGVTPEKAWLIDQKNRLIKKIIELRKKKEMTQSDLAKCIGTTQSVVARIETGNSKQVTLDYLAKILRVLGVTPEFKFKNVA